MSKLNGKAEHKTEATAHQNYMGGNSWDVTDPFVKLRMVAASCFFGEPKYYNEDGSIVLTGKHASEDSICIEHLSKMLGAPIYINVNNGEFQKEMESIIDECLDKDVEKTLQLAVSLRNEDLIRATPQVILVRASMHKNSKGTGLIPKYAKKICIRGDEPAACISYLIAKYGKETPIPNSLKKGLKCVLESFNDYEIAKYKMERNFVKTRDVVNLVHAYSEPIDKLMKGEAKQKDTWNSIVSNADKDEDKTVVWEKAVKGMPHMALLRNLRNLIEHDVDIKLFGDKLVNGVEGGKQLPFRYYSAYKFIKDLSKTTSSHLELLDECIKRAFKNAPHFAGKTICLSDNSGSAWGTCTSDLGTMHVAEIGNMMSVITAQMSDDGEIGLFGDELLKFKIKKTDSALTLIDKMCELRDNIGGGTENGIWLFFDEAIKKKLWYDNIFVYSDMQAGHGGLYGINAKDYNDYIFPRGSRSNYIDVPKLINEYRRVVNKNVMVYLVQTAGYKDILVPEYYDRTFILGGWSQNIPLFAVKMSQIYNQGVK